MSLARPAPLGRRRLRGEGVKVREQERASAWSPRGLGRCRDVGRGRAALLSLRSALWAVGDLGGGTGWRQGQATFGRGPSSLPISWAPGFTASASVSSRQEELGFLTQLWLCPFEAQPERGWGRRLWMGPKESHGTLKEPGQPVTFRPQEDFSGGWEP